MGRFVSSLICYQIIRKEGEESMAEKHWVDNDHYRVVSEDGKTSYLYEAHLLGDICTEVAEHHKDGSTDAYERGGIIDDLFWGGKGKHK